MPLRSESDELLKAEMGQEPSPKGMDRSLDGWNMLRARVSKESNSSIAYIDIGCACGWLGCDAEDECAAMGNRDASGESLPCALNSLGINRILHCQNKQTMVFT